MSGLDLNQRETLIVGPAPRAGHYFGPPVA